jgi:4-amino-4-deoxy-L-arabinose transferase-like glycosyltransferase
MLGQGYGPFSYHRRSRIGVIEAGMSVCPAPVPALPAIILRRPRLMLVLLCLVLWLPGFFSIPATDRDESRFAQASKQMLESGDFIRIMNGEEARLKKPIGIYWAQVPFVAAAQALGVARQNPIWPYRLPSLLGAILAVLGTRALGLSLNFAEEEAWLGAAFLAASAALCIEAHIAKTDAALLGATIWALVFLARARGRQLSLAEAAGFWGALAAAVLIKGPVAPMVVGLSALSHGFLRRDAGIVARLRPGPGFLLFLGLVLPWFVAIGVTTHGAFFSESLGGDLGKKLASGQESHGGFFGWHLLLLLPLAFPATIPVLRGLKRGFDTRHLPATQFLLGTILPAWAVFEAVPTKLPHYTLPLYPAIMLLAAQGYFAALPLSVSWRRVGIILLSLAGAGLIAAWLWLWLWPNAATLAAAKAALLGLSGLAAALPVLAAATLALICVGAALYCASRRPLPALALTAAAYAALLGVAMPQSGVLSLSQHLAEALARHGAGNETLGAGVLALGYPEPSLRFLAGTRMIASSNPGESAAWLDQGGSRLVLVTAQTRADFIARCAGHGFAPQLLEQVRGLDYSNGQFMTFSLYGR